VTSKGWYQVRVLMLKGPNLTEDEKSNCGKVGVKAPTQPTSHPSIHGSAHSATASIEAYVQKPHVFKKYTFFQ